MPKLAAQGSCLALVLGFWQDKESLEVVLFTVDKAHPRPGTSGAGPLQTLPLPRFAFSLHPVELNKDAVGTQELVSWDVARAQATGITTAWSLLPAPGAGNWV